MNNRRCPKRVPVVKIKPHETQETAKETSVNQCSDRGLYHLEICTFDICAILLIGEPGI